MKQYNLILQFSTQSDPRHPTAVLCCHTVPDHISLSDVRAAVMSSLTVYMQQNGASQLMPAISSALSAADTALGGRSFIIEAHGIATISLQPAPPCSFTAPFEAINRIRLCRNIRGITQKDLGVAVGLPEATADIRIAQYESGSRTPRPDLLEKLADALNVNPDFLSAPVISSAQNLIQTLFELDRLSPLHIDSQTNTFVMNLGDLLPQTFLSEWALAKQSLSDTEYAEWKAAYSNERLK